MAELSISEVARRVGMRPSAIRYYERIGIMRPSHRVSGQRRYGVAAVHRLAVVRRAREAGFSLADIRELFFGFEASVPVPARWKKLAARKRLDLDEKIEKLQAMKALLSKLEERCGCETVEQCGVGILRAGFGR